MLTFKKTPAHASAQEKPDILARIWKSFPRLVPVRVHCHRRISSFNRPRSAMYPEDKIEAWQAGQGLWADVDPALWNDWTWQMRHRLVSADDLTHFMKLTPAEVEGCRHADERLAVAITPHYFNLIDRNDPECPLRRQTIPRLDELRCAPEERLDPLAEERDTVAPGLVHRYPDRVLLLATDRCAGYCRHCTRSRIVSDGCRDFPSDYSGALSYIREHTEIRDVLVSGGDPLLLSDERLDTLLGQLRAIDHVEFIRIGSRIPVYMPQRVTPGLCEILKRRGPVWMSLHVNHPRECTKEMYHACEALAYAGVPLGSQTVLLKGVNDDAATMRSLMHRLLMMRVRPYYIYQCDLVAGTAHLRTDILKGIEIIRALRGYTSGYAVPQLVVDAPGGGGKVPLNPDYVESVSDSEIIFRNYEGRRFAYPRDAKMSVGESRANKGK
jgi:lysine 2,3-aminomutase